MSRMISFIRGTWGSDLALPLIAVQTLSKINAPLERQFLHERNKELGESQLLPRLPRIGEGHAERSEL